MAKKKKSKQAKEVVAVFTLSTGRKVPIKAMDVREGGMTHLAQAIIEDKVPNVAKEYGWDKALEVLQLEIADCLFHISPMEKDLLLRSLIWETVIEEWGKLEKHCRKKK